ncbi:MAG: hypothetical protein KGY81_08045 [Phycisphaerae bacterium]|nr:hypothetical protein [Phycisphaerae bacterium]
MLDIHNIDLHYHAGSERSGESSLWDYLEHARMTGRTILGVTDHMERYTSERCQNPYGRPAPEGWKLFREDVQRLAPGFPAMHLLLGPEVSFERADELLTAEVAAVVDYFIIEPPRIYDCTDVETNTDSWVSAVGRIAEIGRHLGKPVHMAHPFRESSNNRLVESPIESWITEMPLRPDCDFSDEEVNHFFMMDVHALGRELAKHGVPTEISGDTVARIARISLPACRQILWAGYRVLQEEGVDLVPGSDHHVATDAIGRVGTPVPSEVFEWLDIAVEDIRHLREFGLVASSDAGTVQGNAMDN